MKLKQFMHQYEGYARVNSQCRVSIYKSPTGITIALVDELPTNHGTSIREFAEHLATQIYRMTFGANDAHVNDFTYIEHAPLASSQTTYVYQRIEFEWDYQSVGFIHPERFEMTLDEVREFLEDESLA